MSIFIQLSLSRKKQFLPPKEANLKCDVIEAEQYILKTKKVDSTDS